MSNTSALCISIIVAALVLVFGRLVLVPFTWWIVFFYRGEIGPRRFINQDIGKPVALAFIFVGIGSLLINIFLPQHLSVNISETVSELTYFENRYSRNFSDGFSLSDKIINISYVYNIYVFSIAALMVCVFLYLRNIDRCNHHLNSAANQTKVITNAMYMTIFSSFGLILLVFYVSMYVHAECLSSCRYVTGAKAQFFAVIAIFSLATVQLYFWVVVKRYIKDRNEFKRWRRSIGR